MLITSQIICANVLQTGPKSRLVSRNLPKKRPLWIWDALIMQIVTWTWSNLEMWLKIALYLQAMGIQFQKMPWASISHIFSSPWAGFFPPCSARNPRSKSLLRSDRRSLTRANQLWGQFETHTYTPEVVSSAFFGLIFLCIPQDWKNEWASVVSQWLWLWWLWTEERHALSDLILDLNWKEQHSWTSLSRMDDQFDLTRICSEFAL